MKLEKMKSERLILMTKQWYPETFRRWDIGFGDQTMCPN